MRLRTVESKQQRKWRDGEKREHIVFLFRCRRPLILLLLLLDYTRAKIAKNHWLVKRNMNMRTTMVWRVCERRYSMLRSWIACECVCVYVCVSCLVSDFSEPKKNATVIIYNQRGTTEIGIEFTRAHRIWYCTQNLYFAAHHHLFLILLAHSLHSVARSLFFFASSQPFLSSLFCQATLAFFISFLSFT